MEPEGSNSVLSCDFQVQRDIDLEKRLKVKLSSKCLAFFFFAFFLPFVKSVFTVKKQVSEYIFPLLYLRVWLV